MTDPPTLVYASSSVWARLLRLHSFEILIFATLATLLALCLAAAPAALSAGPAWSGAAPALGAGPAWSGAAPA
jgi:hypothetical protein